MPTITRLILETERAMSILIHLAENNPALLRSVEPEDLIVMIESRVKQANDLANQLKDEKQPDWMVREMQNTILTPQDEIALDDVTPMGDRELAKLKSKLIAIRKKQLKSQETSK